MRALCYHFVHPVVCQSCCPSHANIGSSVGHNAGHRPATMAVQASPFLCQQGLVRQVHYTDAAAGTSDDRGWSSAL